MEFREFPKIPRLSRNCTITEKIDGTNASVYIGETGEFLTGSRTRWITPENDNHGFSRWAHEHREELVAGLGLGHHFGEWWGSGIQRGYGVPEKRWSLFNTAMWLDTHPHEFSARVTVSTGAKHAPSCCHVVPVLSEVGFTTFWVFEALERLNKLGSVAAPGFHPPEGVIIYHHAAGQYFKKTLLGDEEGKHAEAHPKKERSPKPPRDPPKGGRRIGRFPFEGAEKRKS